MPRLLPRMRKPLATTMRGPGRSDPLSADRSAQNKRQQRATKSNVTESVRSERSRYATAPSLITIVGNRRPLWAATISWNLRNLLWAATALGCKGLKWASEIIAPYPSRSTQHAAETWNGKVLLRIAETCAAIEKVVTFTRGRTTSIVGSSGSTTSDNDASDRWRALDRHFPLRGHSTPPAIHHRAPYG